ncbi:MAG: hypothetical protein AABZ36_04175 [Nitrospirota bacterium]
MNNKRKINIKAIFIGWLVDTVGTVIAGFIIGIIAAVFLAAKDFGADQIAEELSNSAAVQKAAIFIEFTLTFIGGYVAALIAKEDEIKHAVLVGVLSLVSSLIITAAMQQQDPMMYLVSLFILPFAVLGGYLKKTTKKEDKVK